jgi:hypothetical protein
MKALILAIALALTPMAAMADTPVCNSGLIEDSATVLNELHSAYANDDIYLFEGNNYWKMQDAISVYSGGEVISHGPVNKLIVSNGPGGVDGGAGFFFFADDCLVMNIMKPSEDFNSILRMAFPDGFAPVVRGGTQASE